MLAAGADGVHALWQKSRASRAKTHNSQLPRGNCKRQGSRHPCSCEAWVQRHPWQVRVSLRWRQRTCSLEERRGGEQASWTTENVSQPLPCRA